MLNKKNVNGFFLIAIIAVSILLIKCTPKILLITASLDEFKEYIMSMGHFGAIILILFQVLQTIVAPIPGEVVQITGGYLYGTVLGTIYNLIGLIIGAAIAFNFTKLIGREFVEKLINKKSIIWIKKVMESKRFETILFVIFIVPGLPKDFMIYVSGLTRIKPTKFFNILILSRLPWILISASIGANIDKKNIILTTIISVVAILCSIIGMLYKDKIIEKLSR